MLKGNIVRVEEIEVYKVGGPVTAFHIIIDKKEKCYFIYDHGHGFNVGNTVEFTPGPAKSLKSCLSTSPLLSHEAIDLKVVQT